MSFVSEEITKLQLRIIELEKQQKIENETLNKNSISHNFTIITDLLNEKKTSITNNKYSKNVPLARYYDEELVTHLEAIYNILQILDTRLSKIENTK
jgi:hypothetical protein